MAGEHAQLLTVATSHSRAVLSSLAVSTCLPSGEKATSIHSVGMTAEDVATARPVADIPQPRGIVEAAGEHLPAVGREGDCYTVPVWPLNWRVADSARRVRQAHRIPRRRAVSTYWPSGENATPDTTH